MGVATIEEANDPKLAQCLAILAGKTDEHKFAGLLMVAKHLQCEDEAALRRIRKAVLDTTGVSFFVRLLHTQGRGGCADNVETDARVSPFQSLALNLISSNWLFHSELPWVLVSLQLAAIEAKLLLDDAERILIDHIVTPTPPEADEVKVLQRVHSLLPASYGILESILGGLMVEENASALSHTTLLQLKEVLGQVFTVVIEFITTCRDALRSSHLTFSMKDLDPIVLATIRVLGAWMAEETDLLTDQLVALVPFLVTYSPTSSMPVYPMSNVEEPWDSDDEVDDESSAPSLATGTDVMQFLLPGLLQLTATDGGATAVATDDAVLQKILQFTGVVCTRMVAESTASSAHGDLGEGVGTLTMCLGICLNVLLLATPSSACHRLFVKALPMWQSLAILSWRHVVVNNADVDARASDMYLMLLHIVSAMALVQPTAMAATSQLAACSTWLKDHPPSMACEGAWDLHELAMRVMK
ncbi:hypothetical protein DYB32_004057 [Aphanomyces invadans]|uniref:Neurochondrin n=1 Tax=Aphanomyces invadans TaxID=157072 RepID=A0A418AYM7_9STRA|nr:hypothetical protein DYB32_004057 [Aphanomyces invadans]